MDDADRSAILRRRALFVASTLAGLTVTRTSEAQAPGPPPEACSPRTPTSEELDFVKALYERAAEATAREDWVEASNLLQKAYQIAPRSKLLTRLLEVLERREAWDLAYSLAEGHLRCVEVDEAIRAKLEEITSKTGAIVVRVSGDLAGRQITLDGTPLDPSALNRPLRVSTGKHALTWPTEGAMGQSELAIEAGQTVELRVELAIPMPCLSPFPCLEPPYDPPRASRVELGGTVGPMASVRAFHPSIMPYLGVDARFTTETRITDKLAFEADLVTALGLRVITDPDDDARRFFTFGADVGLRYFPIPQYGFGAGFYAGWIKTFDDLFFKDSTVELGPTATPVALHFGAFRFDASCTFGMVPEVDGTWAWLFSPRFVVGFAIPVKEGPSQPAVARSDASALPLSSREE